MTRWTKKELKGLPDWAKPLAARQLERQQQNADFIRTRAKPQYREQDLQIEILKHYYSEVWPEHRGILFCTGSEGKRTSPAEGRLKAMGRIKGTPDLIWIFDGRCILIEVKTDKTLVRDEQRAFLDLASSESVDCYIVRSLGDAKCIFNKYLYPHEHQSETSPAVDRWIGSGGNLMVRSLELVAKFLPRGRDLEVKRHALSGRLWQKRGRSEGL